ncbi:MAG: hypothetical protein RMH75_00855 [Archaeoglobaceae archaeon]|nr:hypothetical protein [Archaeoglobaceae archaeon]MDW7989208.1 hypothetical protein [Archaeoglobaceae archaeon]
MRSAVIDYINLIFIEFMALFALATLHSDFLVPVFHIIIISYALFYIPFTKMFHFVARLLIYSIERHRSPDSVIRKKIKECLNYRVKWSASHIKKCSTWRDVYEGRDRQL